MKAGKEGYGAVRASEVVGIDVRNRMMSECLGRV